MTSALLRVVVTGANGLVGSRLCRCLAGRGHQVTGVSRGASQLAGELDYRACELTDAASVRELLVSLRPDVIVHTASLTAVDECERQREAAYAVNVGATAGLASLAAELGAHLVHVSTDYVFDGAAGPYAEEDVPNPHGVYATTKLMAEHAVRVLAASWAIARTCVVFGWPPSRRPNFGSWLATELAAGRPVRLFEDQWVSPSLADSVAAMLAELAERRLAGLWHTCGGEVLDRLAFGRRFCQVMGFEPSLLVPATMRDVELAVPRPRRAGLRSDKAGGYLDEKPLPLDTALERFRRDYAAERARA